MDKDNGYGFCPICGAPGIHRERRPDGNDCCRGGHTYPSRDALGRPKADVGGGPLAAALRTIGRASPRECEMIADAVRRRYEDLRICRHGLSHAESWCEACWRENLGPRPRDEEG